ncbi:beta-lactamase family protein [Sphingomonas sp. LB-2]|uniref:serine hydrolase domain-containing protein n=1 Tax=Sphingomonas caeni TaxID=2984949 RepID=UPI002231AC91|nr:serine hydrolase [Sphingomonas caeni]MCW3849569.1 beta-lactamase family protein [Sphingomonas caeni]
MISLRPTRAFLALAAAALLSCPAAAQQPAPKAPTTWARSIAAGYKALTLCGAIFNGGRTQAQAEALELTGIYPEYEAIVPTLTATVTRREDNPAVPMLWDGLVTVPFDETLPPRVATWTPWDGCTIYPLTPPEQIPVIVRSGNVPPLVPGNLDQRDWPTGEKGIVVRTPPALQPVIAKAFAGGFSGRTTGVVIVQNNLIIGESYAEGFGPHTSQRTWSVAKSMSGSLIGIASREGLLDVNKAGVVRADADLRGTITIDNLLRMASGLHGDTPGNRTDALYFGGATVDDEAAIAGLDAMPGTRFRYANLDILIAVRALRRAIRDNFRYEAYPRAKLFQRIGMTRTIAERDSGGNFILSSQVWSTARDLARLGIFWLNDGVWNGDRILPQGWMTYMTTPSGPQPATGPGYGATLWLFGPAQGLPEGSYAAQGNRGQFVMVIPSRKLVIVRRGEDAGGAPFDIARFSAEVLKAVP